MHNRVLRNVILSICFLLSLSLFVLIFSGCDIDSRDKVLATVWNKDHITVNGNEYVLVTNDDWTHNTENEGISYSLINNGMWSWEYSLDKMNEIGKIRVLATNWSIASKHTLYASSEEPPIYLCIGADMREVCYMLKSHSLPSKYAASFSSIDFNMDIGDLYFSNAVSMEDIISYEGAILGEDYKGDSFCYAKLHYSKNDIVYLDVDVFRIDEEFYIRLDDVYYQIVMPEILNSLNSLK